MAGVPFYSNLIIGVFEIPFFFILIILGLVAYFKSKRSAVKYAIILFPVVMILNLLAFLIGSFDPFNRELVRTLNPTFVFIVFILCCTVFIMGLRWYIKNKGLIVLYLIISFGLYTSSSLLILLNDYTPVGKYDVVFFISLIAGLAAYLAGISAMTVELVQRRLRKAQ